VKTVQSGELARRAGISADTLRHYERLGILPKPPRTNGGYRDYPANSLERVRLVQSALKVGYSLPELATILRMRDRGEVPCQRVRAIAEHKLEEVKQQINDLLGMRDQLERILKDWDARLARTGRGKQARLLESLPHDVMGSNASRLTAKHLRRGLR
jgi:DNA-binding transcriptional MerR regulator